MTLCHAPGFLFKNIVFLYIYMLWLSCCYVRSKCKCCIYVCTVTFAHSACHVYYAFFALFFYQVYICLSPASGGNKAII